VLNLINIFKEVTIFGFHLQNIQFQIELYLILTSLYWLCQRRKISSEQCSKGYFNKIMYNYRRGIGSLVLMHDIHSVTPKTVSILLDHLENTGINWEFILVQDIPAVRNLRTDI